MLRKQKLLSSKTAFKVRSPPRKLVPLAAHLSPALATPFPRHPFSESSLSPLQLCFKNHEIGQTTLLKVTRGEEVTKGAEAEAEETTAAAEAVRTITTALHQHILRMCPRSSKSHQALSYR